MCPPHNLAQAESDLICHSWLTHQGWSLLTKVKSIVLPQLQLPARNHLLLSSWACFPEEILARWEKFRLKNWSWALIRELCLGSLFLSPFFPFIFSFPFRSPVTCGHWRLHGNSCPVAISPQLEQLHWCSTSSLNQKGGAVRSRHAFSQMIFNKEMSLNVISCGFLSLLKII